jgi:hypothetical protein
MSSGGRGHCSKHTQHCQFSRDIDEATSSSLCFLPGALPKQNLNSQSTTGHALGHSSAAVHDHGTGAAAAPGLASMQRVPSRVGGTSMPVPVQDQWVVHASPSPPAVFTTHPSAPSQMKPPLLVSRDRRELKVCYILGDARCNLLDARSAVRTQWLPGGQGRLAAWRQGRQTMSSCMGCTAASRAATQTSGVHAYQTCLDHQHCVAC